MNCYIFSLLLLLSFPLIGAEKLALQFETGYLWQHRNDVKIAPSSGDLVEFDKFNHGPFSHYRAELFWNFGKRHGLRLIFAPLNISVTGQQSNNVNFNGQTFAANQDITIDYMFNSYRIGYYYSLLKGKWYFLNIGITGKIRHAEIKFTQSGVTNSYDNIGFVPLLYLAYYQRISKNLSVGTDADFAAAPQGRAFDVTFKLRYHLSQNYSLGIGYRTLEGGAENEKVYTFSWFNYLLLDLKINLL